MNESVRNAIVRLFAQGLSQRRIARQVQVARHTVQRVLRQVAQARDAGAALPVPAVRPRRCLEPFAELLEQLLGRYPDLTSQPG
jgi:transposase